MSLVAALRGLDTTQRHTVLASFLGWTLDAFDFFLLVFVLDEIATEFHVGHTEVTFGILLTLAARPIGALIFGRLADRYVVRAALAVANGRAPEAAVNDAFERLPAVMAKAEGRDGQIERAVIDLAETAVLSGREGEDFGAVVTDLGENGARIQLCDVPVVARVVAHGVLPGARIKVRLTAADTARRTLSFSRIE